MIQFELKRAILNSGLKQDYIARRLNLQPTVFSKKIHGWIKITKDEKNGLSRLLNIPAKVLFPSPSSNEKANDRGV